MLQVSMRSLADDKRTSQKRLPKLANASVGPMAAFAHSQFTHAQLRQLCLQANAPVPFASFHATTC